MHPQDIEDADLEDGVTTIHQGAREVVAARPDPKVLICGTGRSGTTLLVQILTDLGMDTGVTDETPIDERAAAGLELPVTGPDSPRIVKSPELSRTLGPLLDAGRVQVEHVIVPVRALDVAAASRVRLTRYGANLHTWGGLFGTTRATRQREALAVIQYELMFTIAEHDLAHTLLLFPRFARDWRYLHEKLGFLDPSIPPDRWRDAVAARVRPERIHEVPLSRYERWMTVAGTYYNLLIARPLRVARRALGVGAPAAHEES